MKLVIAIVHKDDTATVEQGLRNAGIYSTKLATTGGFLMSGNTTFLIGVEESQVDDVINNIERHSRKRSQVVPSKVKNASQDAPNKVKVGGAVVFVVDVEKFERL